MSDLNINCSNVEQTVGNIKSFVETNVIEECTVTKTEIFGALHDSAGDYMEALKVQVEKETQITAEIGNLLIKIAEFVQEAAQTMKSMDESYSNTKVK